jgi:iron complex transport system permease protein
LRHGATLAAPGGWSRWAAAAGLAAVVAALAVAELSVGEPMIAPARLPGILFGESGDRVERLVVHELRLPRLILAVLGGAAFGLSGAILRIVLRNPLASPELLGVSAGASLAMAVVLLLHVPVLFSLHPVVALAGGLGGGVIVLMASRGARSPVEAALTGVAVAALLNGVILAVISLAASSGAVQVFFLFTVGNLSNRSWDHVALVWPWLAVAIPAALVLARSANVLQLDDDVSSSLGMRTRQLRAVLVVLAAVLVAALIAVAGPIAWVGLLTPHLAGLLVGRPDARLVFPAAMAIGAVLLLTSDVLAKVVVYPREVPVGLCTTLVAAPPVLWLLRRSGLGPGR